MRVYDHHAVEDRLDWPGLIQALRESFARGAVVAPPRQSFTIDLPDSEQATLLVMPAWEAGKAVGVKVVTFYPGNAAKGQATINAGYLLFDGADGRFVAAMDGDGLTARRTAAASALAADYLARRDVKVLTVVGTGQLAGAVAAAHSSVRSYERILIWGRSPEKAEATAVALRAQGLPAEAQEELEAACRAADVVSSVTASTQPLIHGAWMREGSHLDLIGAFKADMRESDTLAVTRSRVFVDGRAGALLAGDLAQPIAENAFDPALIVADLAELTRGAPGRQCDAERTLFKSVGLSLEDLVGATMVAETG
ncbi:ornithine cyclodeaminase family protein (plasmid) [Agrobacterium tumefaciens]|uniref:Ornithine cyclodeaminase family protein n=1 Tax=Agrobacterium tumefaciens TaxID=358 RepID=A0AAP9EAE9_AGRTU|nr:ornithine cyclodeaminase family protein [Agrobacterium tumefaciens]NSZ61204.1 ornithine cyclodeaminase family protein [Agrobacterium tumefaciens]QDY97612.1 ornithine cyclodeaminase family protein [Agrobacterium tumefaciens]UXS12738.1 ornithine cyclodeaminase family protein [Agrobacterium tumefaciens]UXS20100.1 ornithine cyclodeaminase family protein [Agrobacterium tumefaciens]UXS27748.1 ornithine cyclodeaminase family protein [Agrobacterium tumefaciens]